MKTATAGMISHLNGEVTTMVGCMKLVLTKHQPRIVAVTRANPGVITTRWAHGLTTGDVIKIRDVRGMIQLNRQEYQITVIDAVKFSIDANTSSYTTYTHKGIVQKVVGYTAHYTDLIFDKVTYRATLGYTPDSVKQSADMAIDSVEHRGILRNAAKDEIGGLLLIDGITDEDLIAGRYDNAIPEIFRVNFADLTQGRIIYPISGRVSETVLHRGVYQAEISGKQSFLNEAHQEVYSANCRADLGDDLDGSEPEHELKQGFGCKVRLDPPYWTALTAYTVRPPGDAGLGSVVKPLIEQIPQGRQFMCTTAGTSGAAEPSWNNAIGGTTADGTVVWTAFEALTKIGAVYQAIDRRRFIDLNRYEAPLAGLGGTSTLFPIIAINQGAKRFTIAGNFASNFPAQARFTIVGSPLNDGTYQINSSSNSGPNTLITVYEPLPSPTIGGSIIGRLPSLLGFFTFGLVTFLTGKNKGISREVRAFSTTTTNGTTFTGPGSFEMFEAFPFDIAVGDQYEARAGCDKSLKTCVERFDNVHNRRAEDNIPGSDKMLLYPDSK
jgi:hypothetical protein